MTFIMRFIFTALLMSPISAMAQKTNATILSSHVVCKEPGRYIGWPSVTLTNTGELLAVFSGDRDEHVCPWGKTELVRSTDNGRTWSESETINNTPLDDRDAGIIFTKEGTIIVSWFTSLAFDDERYLKHYPKEITRQWKRHSEKLGPETRKEWLGCWLRRSTDGGKTWGDFIHIPINAPHGPIQLSDGRLLYVGKTLWETPKRLETYESVDDGLTWRKISDIPVAKTENISHYHELHAVENTRGEIITMIRYNPPDRNENIMRQTISKDGGKTWSPPASTGIWGYPPHLLRCSDGRIITVYGYRREPYGERAVVSVDGGHTWNIDAPIELNSALDGDLGYPASVQLRDGSIYTVYYQIDKQGEKTCLMGTRWKLE